MSDTLAQAIMWLVTFGLGIGAVGLVKWIEYKHNRKHKENLEINKTLKRLDKR